MSFRSAQQRRDTSPLERVALDTALWRPGFDKLSDLRHGQVTSLVFLFRSFLCVTYKDSLMVQVGGSWEWEHLVGVEKSIVSARCSGDKKVSCGGARKRSSPKQNIAFQDGDID